MLKTDKKKLKSFIWLKYPDMIIMLLAVAMGYYFSWNIADSVIFGVFIWIFLNPVSSRYPAAVSIGLLIFSPVFIILGKKILAEQLAIYAYYFLIMTVVMGIYELKKEKKSEDKI